MTHRVHSASGDLGEGVGGDMKKFWLLIFLVVSMAHAACPNHPGYILNGRAAQPSSLQVICGQVYTVFKKGYEGSTATWVELYSFKNSAEPRALGGKIDGILSRLGFTQIQHKSPSSTEQIFGYANTSTGKIVSMYIFLVGQIVFISFSGN